MKEEPEIVKILKKEEKLGKLPRKSPFSFENLQIYEGSAGHVSDKTTMVFKDDFGTKTDHDKRVLTAFEDEELYRTLVENVLEGILILDFKGNVLFANPAVANMLGFKSVHEVIGKNVLSFVDPKFHKKVIKNQDLVRVGKEAFLDTYQVTTADGRKIWVEGLGTKILYMSETANVVYIRDITERKEIEESLRASEERFKQLYDKAPIPYHALSPTGIITNVNEKWCNTLKYTKEEVTGKSIFDFVIKSEKGLAKASFEKKIIEKKPYTGGHERTYVAKNGEERIFIIHDYFSFDESKNVRSVHTTMEDITQRRQVWDKMVKSEEKYRVLAETSADGVLTTDVLGRLTYVNPSLEKILGRRKSKTLATPFRNYLSESTVYLFQQAFLDVRKKGRKMENMGLDVIHKDRYEIPVEANIAPLKKDGKFIGIECTVRDVSERKRIERELKRSEKLRTEFMNIAAHELKSPITPIKGYLELIESDKNASEKIKNWARIGMRNAERLMCLVNDILDVSRLDTNTMRFNMEKCDLGEILDSAIEDIKPDIENKNLRFIKEMPDNLPKIVCDNHRLSQVLKNLLGNAIKFTDYGAITLRAEEKEGDLFIYVQDTGIGISSDETKKIFTKFYQAYTGEDRKNEGTGLGLFICKEIVKKHNGEIWAESKVGKGSKFTIKLPL
ncbi:MAG: PAS domain-containing sensor histidine kinase [Thermoplasmatales archaeon]|nr:MAG: PAS domain-containing sensor histidine kinase [Thermoplasmatales archaeon]